ncbi:MAG: hypothetical protein PHS66_06650 [Candidatus Omnitrophica bacterium]|nr:hypothetical protein [Candidatus Omnitrophota bacterium]
MIISKLLKAARAGLFIVVFLSFAGICAAELNVPLPQGAVKVGEQQSEFGSLGLSVRIYKAPLNEDGVYAFYEEKMAAAGWNLSKKGVFTKGRQRIVMRCYPKKNNETKFSITVSNLPDINKLLATIKKKPDKLTFMPIYPGSVQVLSMKFSGVISYVYETEDILKDVVFFYESSMLKYGWGLVDREPVTGVANKVTLLFHRRNGEVCKIKVDSAPAGGLSGLLSREESATSKVSAKPSDKTRISVEYKL